MKKLLIAACTVAAVGVMTAPAEAQAQFGIQANYADDFDFGVGVRGQFGLGEMLNSEGGLGDLMGVVSFDYYFPDCPTGVDCSYWEINGNALYPIEVEGSDLAPYLGGGLHIGRVSVGDFDDSEVGLNAVGGLMFDLGGFATFVEAKIELGGAEQFVLTFGGLFGGN